MRHEELRELAIIVSGFMILTLLGAAGIFLVECSRNF